ncbi:MAG: hypothetical protein OXI57_02875 [Rhodospirillales bacterium]|nr:hypothetical protein [Rhodospirillales bacterium]
MTETVYLTLPAAELARPAAPSTTQRPARDHDRAAASLAAAEAQLRKADGRARARADARASTSNEAIVARARALMAEPGAALNAIEAVDRAQAEAGLQPSGQLTTDDIVARARQLMAASGGTLNAVEAVHRAGDEAATLASRDARAQKAMERRHAQWVSVNEVMEDTAAALERRLMVCARDLIAAARRTVASDPIKARELAIRAREAMAAISPLFDRKPDHGPARRILEGAGRRPA